MTVSKEIENIFLKEVSLTDIILTLLSENIEYADSIQELVDNISTIGDAENDSCI